MKILKQIIYVIAVIFIIAFLFCKLWLPLGAKADKERQNEYQKRAKNYQKNRFKNLKSFQMIYRVEKGQKDYILSQKKVIPQDNIPIQTPSLLKVLNKQAFTVTWLGHSSLLLQMHGLHILCDPVFSLRTSPVSFIGKKRFSALPLAIKDLPTIDIVMISHDHYDHLDYKTIKAIDKKVKYYVVPLGIENHLERWHIDSKKIISMAWWEKRQINGLTVVCTPARHYSIRNLDNGYCSLWSSWLLKDEYHQIFFSGDTGYDHHFCNIYQHYGAFDLVMMDCGQYDLRWKDTHMNPEQSYQAAKDLHAKNMLPIHWGAYRLANHPWDDPIERLMQVQDETVHILTPMIGQTFDLENIPLFLKWWEKIR